LNVPRRAGRPKGVADNPYSAHRVGKIHGDDPAVRSRIMALREEGLTYAQIARRLNLSYQWVWTICHNRTPSGSSSPAVPPLELEGGPDSAALPATEAGGLADWVRRGLMTIDEVRELIIVTPRDREVLLRLERHFTVSAAIRYREEVLSEFDAIVEREQLVDRTVPKVKVEPPPLPPSIDVRIVEDELAVSR
jgi:hypothetical protein